MRCLRHRARSPRSAPCLAWLVAGLVASGSPLACAPRQRVPIDPECSPQELTVYVDGEALDEVPTELTLRSDEPHKIFFKAPGHQPQLVVLDPQRLEDGRIGLQPDEICVELVPVAVGRELEIEIEEDETGAPASDTTP